MIAMADYTLVLYRIGPETASTTRRYVVMADPSGRVLIPEKGVAIARYETDDSDIFDAINRLVNGYVGGGLRDRGLLDGIKNETGLEPVKSY